MNCSVLLAALLLLAVSGCSTMHSDLSSLQGKWRGTEPGREGVRYLTVNGNKLEFRGVGGEWYKGTFSLREKENPKQIAAMILDCPAPQYLGKAVNAVYSLRGDKLTLAGAEPGDSRMPSGFDDPNARRFDFTRE